MPQFSPQPLNPETWWINRRIDDVWGVGEDPSYKLRFGPDTWLAWVVYWSESDPPPWGYPVVFPTATDCLMWLRWCVIPGECWADDEVASEVEIGDPALQELVDRIGGYPDGTRSERVLAEVLGGVRLQRLDICKVESIHSFFSSTVTLEEARFVFDDPGVNLLRGRWLLAGEHWEELAWCWREYPEEADLRPPGTILFRTMLHNRNALTLAEADWALTSRSEGRERRSSRAEILEALQQGRLHGVPMEPNHFLSYRERETRDDDWMVIMDGTFRDF